MFIFGRAIVVRIPATAGSESAPRDVLGVYADVDLRRPRQEWVFRNLCDADAEVICIDEGRSLVSNREGERAKVWEEFDQLVADGKITSTREVFHELGDGSPGADLEWAKANAKLFTTPDAKEGAFVAKIYAVGRFQTNIEKQKLYKGGRNADAFVVARAHAIGGTVVTMERLKPNAVKVPNICAHFKIPYLDLEGFMESEGWEF